MSSKDCRGGRSTSCGAMVVVVAASLTMACADLTRSDPILIAPDPKVDADRAAAPPAPDPPPEPPTVRRLPSPSQPTRPAAPPGDPDRLAPGARALGEPPARGSAEPTAPTRAPAPAVAPPAAPAPPPATAPPATPPKTAPPAGG